MTTTTKRKPIEKMAMEYELNEGEMVMCCAVCNHINTFTEETIAKVGIELKDIKFVGRIDYVDTLWNEVPGKLKRIKAYKAIKVHYKKEHPNATLPPLYRKGTKEMEERKRARAIPKRVFINGIEQTASISSRVKRRRRAL